MKPSVSNHRSEVEKKFNRKKQFSLLIFAMFKLPWQSFEANSGILVHTQDMGKQIIRIQKILRFGIKYLPYAWKINYEY